MSAAFAEICCTLVLVWSSVVAAQNDGWGGRSDRRYTLPRGIRLKDRQRFDYIVVGAGGAGAAVASRLALAGEDVLLIEAGGDPSKISKIPAAATVLTGSSNDWAYETISNNISCLSYRNKQCRFSRGRCLGGSTSINNMIHTRGTPDDFDSLNITDWTWEDIKPYFLRFEGLKDLKKLPPSSIPYHNTKGTMRMQFFASPKNPWQSRLVEGYKALNIPFNPDVNAKSMIGVTKIIGYVFENERMSTARGFLGRNDVKKRLKVAKFTTCTGVIIGNDNIAQGITAVQQQKRSRVKLRLYANKEVILSAGALATPQILMLSGIGNAEHLQQFNIPLKSDLPVGDDMTDHYMPLVFVKVPISKNILKKLLNLGTKVVSKVVDLTKLILFNNKGSLGSNGLSDINVFLNTNCYDFDNRQLKNDRPECDLPTLQIIHSYLRKGLVWIGPRLFQIATDLNDAVTQQLKRISKKHELIIFTPLVLKALSKGTVRLASRNPLAHPAIRPNYLADDRDLQELVRGVKIIEQLMDLNVYRRNKASIVRLKLKGCPAYEHDSHGYWECYCRHMTHTTYHALGTTALGRVVDERLRVLGVQKLRVVDLGILPSLPRANTAAAAIAIGERAADFILTGN